MAKTDPSEVLERDGESGYEDPGLPPGEPGGTDLSNSAYSSSESEFAAPPDAHVKQSRAGTRGGGQNKKVDPAIGIPNPPFRLYKGDATNPNQRVKPFCNYWNGLPQWAKENSLLYVYRDHPVLLYVEKDPEGKQRDFEFNYIDKISGAEPLQDEADLLHRYGCGNYKLVFNAIETGKANRTLCTVYATNIGGGDFKSNPPTDRRISDTKNVDLNYPSNASYVAYLRGQGLLPNQIDAIKGEQEMASIELVKEQQTTTSKLVDTVVKMAQEKSAKSGDEAGVLEKAMTGAMDIMAKGSEAAIKVTQQANEYASRVREETDSKRSVATVTPVTDPMDTALRIVALLRDNKGKDDPEVAELRRLVDKMRDDQLVSLRDELKAIRERPADHASNPFNSIEAGMKAMKQMKEVVDEISGGKDDKGIVDEAINAAGPAWLQKYSPLIQQGLQFLTPLVTGLFMRGQPMPGYPTPGYPPPGYPQNPQGFAQPGWNGPGPQWQPPAPTPPATGPQLVQARHPLATLDPTQFTPELAQILSAIATPLHIHIRDFIVRPEEVNGSIFADWFQGGYPEETYTQIVQFGPDGVTAALYSFPLTLAAIQQFPVEKVQEFVAEFLNPVFDDEGAGVEGEGDKTPEPDTEPEPKIPA